jgi:tetratricopeptide (TPR) repeat protein
MGVAALACIGSARIGDDPVANLVLAKPDHHKASPATALLRDTVLALSSQAFELHTAGRLHEAVALYERIISFKDLPVIRGNLGHALAQLGKFDAAIVEYRRAVQLKPDYPEALCNWGVALANLGRADEAEEKYRRAIIVDAGFAGAHHNLGVILKEAGRLDEARHAATRAIHLAPRNTSYYEHLATLRPFVAGDRYITALEILAKNPAGLSDAEQTHLHFALARAYEDTGSFGAAFAQLLAGNRLKRRHIGYDEAATLGCMDRMHELFGADFMARYRGAGLSSALPVFIVGMPRSGTTLIEQILASHPEIFGAGELTLFDQAAGALIGTLPGSPPFPDMALSLSGEHFRALAETYLGGLAQRAPAASRIVDKMPGNFLFAGLIHLALPNAVIIHAMRDPIDTCLSCFSTLFSGGQEYTYDIAELGRYYRHYRALMAHWRSVLPPGRIVDVRYEDLVSDVEGVARRLVGHCGLAWDPRCLDFHRTERVVRTASATQVRRPIYQSSVGRWRKYQEFLGPLTDEIACTHPRQKTKETIDV